MKKLFWQVSLKYGGILGAIALAINSIIVLTSDINTASELTSGLSWILSLLSFVVCIAMAHYKFNNKNQNYISFKDAFLIGLVIIGFDFVISIAFAKINLDLSIKDSVYASYARSRSSQILFSSLFSLLLTKILFLLFIITAEANWKIFKKAGKQGWAALIPIYNLIVLLEIVEKPSWWFILLLIPFVNVIFAIWITNLLSKKFGKDESFTAGLVLLPIIFYPLLGLSKAEYINNNYNDLS